MSARRPLALSLLRILILLLALSVVGPASYAQETATQEPETQAAQEAETQDEASLQERIDKWFDKNISGPLWNFLMFGVGFDDAEVVDAETGESHAIARSVPFIILVLVLGGIFFTIRYGFVNIRLIRHSLDVIRGKYDDPEDAGEISHFKALTSALSATVGLGNISGVAIAIALGGPGAIFWMWLTAFLGMSLKFSSCCCAQMFRRIHPDGRVLGGPMIYLEDGLKSVWPSLLGPVAKIFAVLFAIFTIGAAFGAGNLYQTNQTASILAFTVFNESTSDLLKLAIGVIMAILTGVVIIGGIRRIGDITSKMVPAMCIFYCAICLAIVVINFRDVPEMFATIFTSAFSAPAVYGGFLGVVVQGMRRAVFSNEGGLGSASIAQAAAKTKEPVQAAVVAMIGPFIDTIIVCTMTALAILITKAHVSDLEDIRITALAFAELGAVAPYFLCIAVFVFAYSSIVSWGYYGERAVESLVGRRGILPFRVIYVFAAAIGPLLSIDSIIALADGMAFSMAFPNIIGMIFLSGLVKKMIDDYVRRLKAGEIQPVT